VSQIPKIISYYYLLKYKDCNKLRFIKNIINYIFIVDEFINEYTSTINQIMYTISKSTYLVIHRFIFNNLIIYFVPIHLVLQHSTLTFF